MLNSIADLNPPIAKTQYAKKCCLLAYFQDKAKVDKSVSSISASAASYPFGNNAIKHDIRLVLTSATSFHSRI